MTGPAGDFSLRSPVSGDLGIVHLPQLQLIAGQGQASGNLSLGFADGIDWNTTLALSAFDPSYWVAELPGQLGGTLASRGILRGEALQAEAQLDLNGTLRRQPLQLQLDASGLKHCVPTCTSIYPVWRSSGRSCKGSWRAASHWQARRRHRRATCNSKAAALPCRTTGLSVWN